MERVTSEQLAVSNLMFATQNGLLKWSVPSPTADPDYYFWIAEYKGSTLTVSRSAQRMELSSIELSTVYEGKNQTVRIVQGEEAKPLIDLLVANYSPAILTKEIGLEFVIKELSIDGK